MNTVLSSYGQLCGCPEILKKSCKFFCRGLDIRVTNLVYFVSIILSEFMQWVLVYVDFLNGSEYPKMKSKVILHKLACNLIQKHYNNTIGKIFEHKR